MTRANMTGSGQTTTIIIFRRWRWAERVCSVVTFNVYFWRKPDTNGSIPKQQSAIVWLISIKCSQHTRNRMMWVAGKRAFVFSVLGHLSVWRMGNDSNWFPFHRWSMSVFTFRFPALAAKTLRHFVPGFQLEKVNSAIYESQRHNWIHKIHSRTVLLHPMFALIALVSSGRRLATGDIRIISNWWLLWNALCFLNLLFIHSALSRIMS